MDGLGIVAQAPLQHAHTVHHRVDALEARQPDRNFDVAVEVAGNPLDVWQEAGACGKVATTAHDGPAFTLKRARQLAADEAICAGDETAHGMARCSGRP